MMAYAAVRDVCDPPLRCHQAGGGHWSRKCKWLETDLPSTHNHTWLAHIIRKHDSDGLLAAAGHA